MTVLPIPLYLQPAIVQSQCFPSAAGAGSLSPGDKSGKNDFTYRLEVRRIHQKVYFTRDLHVFQKP